MPQISHEDFNNVFTLGGITADSGDASATLGAALGGNQEAYFANVVDVHNPSGANTIDSFIGGRFPNADWIVGTWDDDAAGDSFTDDTTDAQDAGASDVPIGTAGTNNDGIVIGAIRPFDCCVIDVGTAEVGGATDEWTYWNGSAWATLVTLVVPDFGTAEEQAIVFLPPSDWSNESLPEGITASHYPIRYRATAAPVTTAPAGSIFQVGAVLRCPVFRTEADKTSHGHDMWSLICADDETPWVVHTDAAAGVEVIIQAYKKRAERPKYG